MAHLTDSQRAAIKEFYPLDKSTFDKERLDKWSKKGRDAPPISSKLLRLIDELDVIQPGCCCTLAYVNHRFDRMLRRRK